MSFKGFTKAISRAPQTFRQKMNMGPQTEDPVYEDAERRFKELEDETKKLSDESKRYSIAVTGMLTHQIGFAKAMEEIFKPISGRMSDPNATIQEDNPQGIEASEQYRAIVADLQVTLKPDLTLVEEKVVKPCQELLKVITYIRKMATKRNHKKLDLDRRLNAVTKIENKKEQKPKDEERLYKAQAEMEVAQQEYDYYNNMLKDQLPILFSLEAQFVQPLFVSFYYMQLNIFYTLYNKFQEMQIPYFDLNSDILEAFQAKRGNIEEQTDALTITHFKVGYSKAKLEMTRKRYGHGAGPGNGSAYNSQENTPSPTGDYNSNDPYGQHNGYGQDSYNQNSPTQSNTPGYGQGPPPNAGGYEKQSPSSTGSYGQNGANPGYNQQPQHNAYQSPPATGYEKPTPYPTAGNYQNSNHSLAGSVPPSYTSATGVPQSAPAFETVTALYEYQAQAEGDLSFPAGAVIEIVQRTADINEWWTGKYNGQQGVFPGNYVKINKS
ncbi:hypothetical protein TBLA_0A02570 [Henningerozyma blattae CBS 6284]|uniref:SH3 domain-containing protein n=1 Tax=Henningerozyma blattae (strain ATCC 34711 / CBS 6284 / DSM 70876 / NBRC 10599 / NRRL Y-10934 / UCD 77-7) TaxID=1071380 RepID=I2GVA4_HENB6|nr:hypothetical protein TBLA_0A02570 [Tetrapisispora blattae CBS 6284]CCH58056.1 hypothetical protein TBLA_0A02570 [Tetrapisispora blattae CBS 6284]